MKQVCAVQCLMEGFCVPIKFEPLSELVEATELLPPLPAPVARNY